MAYLLTEIALEMLGCRFYDINGLPQDIKYITSDEIPLNSQLTALKNEPHLDTLLSLSSTSPSHTITTATTTNSGIHSSTAEANIPSGSTSTSSCQLEDVIEIHDGQIEQEIELINQQLLHEPFSNNFKLKPNTTEKDLQLVVDSFIYNEHKKLNKEWTTLRDIRVHLENAITKK